MGAWNRGAEAEVLDGLFLSCVIAPRRNCMREVRARPMKIENALLRPVVAVLCTSGEVIDGGCVGRRRFERLRAQEFAHLRRDNFAAVGGERRANDFVLQVEVEIGSASD